MQARREAMAADLVVVNHHLFFADMALRDSGVARTAADRRRAVFDEAHQLVEAGCAVPRDNAGDGAGDEVGRDLLAAGLQYGAGLATMGVAQSASRWRRCTRVIVLIAPLQLNCA
jgi:ATP-dependent DNA helicase DinG